MHEQGAEILLAHGKRLLSARPATVREIFAHTGDFAIRPASLGLSAVDIDAEGEIFCAYLKWNDVRFRAHRSERNWHAWVRGTEKEGRFVLAGASGEVKHRGHIRVYDTAAILEAVELTPAPQIFPARNPPRQVKDFGYVLGNRQNQLNSDVWYASIFQKPIKDFRRRAEYAGLTLRAIEATVNSTRRRAGAAIDQSLAYARRRGLRLGSARLYAVMLAVSSTGVCWAAHSNLASGADLSRRQVIRLLGELENRGLLERVERRRTVHWELPSLLV